MTNPNMLELKQKYLFERREFFLEPNHIRLYVKDLDGETEIHIQYETITSSTRVITRQDGRVYLTAISCGIFALIGFGLHFAGISALMRWAPLWAVASVVFFGFHFFKRRKYFILDLSDRKSVFFLANQPSKEKLQDFVKSLYEKRRKYLREKYFVFNPTNDPDNEIARFNLLLEQKIISEWEFQEMKAIVIAQKGETESQIKVLIN